MRRPGVEFKEGESVITAAGYELAPVLVGPVAVEAMAGLPAAESRPGIAADIGALGRLVFPRTAEPAWRTHFYAAIALALVVAYFLSLSYFTYFNPSHSGVDQNGYLVGGKMMADHGTTGFWPTDPYQFVGRMWVGAAANQYSPNTPAFYPKYPIGLPAIYALLIKIGGANYGAAACFFVSPVCMSLGIGATFLLVRAILGSFAGLLGLIVVASSQLTLALTNNPNSHASTLFFVTAGMFLLIQWWRYNGLWRAILAGLLLGYAVTIRYTEATLILPVGLAILFNVRARDWSSWRDSVFLLLSWAVPVTILVSYNLWFIGTVTGYDPCNESTGFKLEYAQDNWDTMLRHLANYGLFFIFPFSVLGLLGMFRWHWKLASLLLAWVMPAIILYTAYYWAPDGNTVGYVRFYLTILPALALAAIWAMLRFSGMLESGLNVRWRAIGIGAGAGLVLGIALGALAGYSADRAEVAGNTRAMMAHTNMLQFAEYGGGIGALAGAVAASCPLAYIVAIGALIGVYSTLPLMERDAEEAQIMKTNVDTVRDKVPAGSIVFGDERIFHYLQFSADYKLYSPELFERNSLQRLQNIKLDEPSGFQPQRAKDLWERVKNKTDRDLLTEQNKLMSNALASGKRVFFISRKRSMADLLRRFATASTFSRKTISSWNESRPAVDVSLLKARKPRGAGGAGMPFFRPRGMTGDPSWMIVEILPRVP